MAEPVHKIEIGEADREAFALCLALGTLEAIRSNAWPVEAAIWTIARPCFVEPLQDSGIPEAVLNVLRNADELGAIQKLVGADELQKTLVEWISLLRARLAELPERSWHARWLA
jgi:hypothetical protein